MRILFLFLISFLLINCNPIAEKIKAIKATNVIVTDDNAYSSSTDKNLVDEYGNPYTVDEFSKDDEPRGNQRRSCRSRNNGDSDLTVESLKYIDSYNITDYLVKGKCVSGERVDITINGYPIDEKIYCRSKKWELTVNLTPLAKEKVISFNISSLDESLCEDVKVAFTSPKNYITIPALKGYYESSFLVMKYEAKLHKAGVNSKGISQAKGRPISSVSYNDAKTLCENNGTRYALMSNKQWQNIALDIESVDENWSLKKARVIEGNGLNCGNSRGAVKEASSSDNNDCGAASCDRDWDYHRRTHLLSSGDRIWDMCGNVGEIMKDKYTRSDVFNNYVYYLTGKLKKLFGPNKRYDIISVNRRDNFFGLGHVKINQGSNLIIRGASSRYSGIFSTEITRDRDLSSRSGNNVGFRCVYLP